ncbi:right-handed parallel beta-helix repeat-containing protein [Nitratireductor sp. GZWM139]|uniref:right-handed parallel beta-helix repeat-containing protein n=1 Tax=Nitratireductor sp. GZWM139 TaxID=2950541 RepID=UPI0024BD67F6|nr:right-handed parallel beta-helix repeat-containing protein [Nitratireductor sp. GZWM139]MDJ1463323.1 hypothetical protein [Nitratireductor sp. GZWM139]
MSIFSKLGALIFAPTDAAGNPRQVINHDAQVWSTEVERIVQVALEGGDLLVYGSLSALNADLDHAANTGAILIGESIADDGLYMKQGASGSGSWVKIGNVPGQGFVRATNAGAGTPNTIAATTPVAVNETQLILLPITAANTASPVTVAFNGGVALTVKTVSGNDVAVGGLPAGSVMLGVVQGGDFRLLSDQASAAIVAAAEAAASRSEAAASVASGSMTTVIDPQFSNVATARAFAPAVAPEYIRTAGLVLAGDGRGALYRLVAAEPTHARKFPITLADGVTVKWYEAAQMTGVPTGGFIGDTLIKNSDADGDYLWVPRALSSTTYRIPEDYPTLQTAFNELGGLPKRTGAVITIRISSGHLLISGLRLSRGDYSHFRITSESGDILLSPAFPAMSHIFYGDKGCVMPSLECLIDAEGRGRTGIYLDTGASMLIDAGAGVIRAGYFGLLANRASKAVANGTNFRYAGSSGSTEALVDATGISARRGSIIHADDSDVRDAVKYGVSSSQVSQLSFNNGRAASCGSYGIRAEEGAVIDCWGAQARDAGIAGIYAWQGAVINARHADVAKNAQASTRRGFYAAEGSHINAHNGIANAVLDFGFEVVTGSTINASGGLGTLSQNANAITAAGIIYQ